MGTFQFLTNLIFFRVISITLIFLIVVPLLSIGYARMFLRIVSFEKLLKIRQKMTKEEEESILSNLKKEFSYYFKDVKLNDPYSRNGVKQEDWLEVVNILTKKKSMVDRTIIYYFIIPASTFLNIKESRSRMMPIFFFITMFFIIYFGKEVFISELWSIFMLYLTTFSLVSLFFIKLVYEQDGLNLTQFYIILGNPMSTVGRIGWNVIRAGVAAEVVLLFMKL